MNLRLPSSLRTRPPFRADHVGSFLRPQALLDMRRRWKDRENTARELRDCEDEAIAELVGFQESLGLQGVTDGEFRRETFHGDFINAFEGMEFKQVFKPGTTAAGGHAAPFIAVTTGKLKRPEGGFEVENFRYLHGLTDRVAKQTIPSPTMAHFRGGREAVDRTAYPEMDAFFADLARVYREEVHGLADAGCRYLQLDDTNLAYLCDETMRQNAAARGEDLDRLPRDYARLINESITGRPGDMAVCIHLCRGNARSRWFAEGGYEPVAEVIFNEIDVDGFLLEFDDARSGGFEPLRLVPKDKIIVLGLVSSKWARLEDKNEIIRRIEEASRYIDLDQLCLSPQCGFASVSEGNEIDRDVEVAKIRLIQEVVETVWG
jgi:5-methyltetrahydropteroyltriglutamate--homocysteine methyltransferase